jgi:inosose dehydratase
MGVRIGISPIAWQNDDLPDLTAAFTMAQCLTDARDIGFTGIERGRRMPADLAGLRDFLGAHDMALCGGWCSGNLLVNDVAAEIASIRQQVEQFAALNAPCIIYAECSNTVQGRIDTPLSLRPRLSRDGVMDYAARLSELAKWCANQGVPLAYHHHMGAIIETEAEVDWLMQGSSPDVHLLFDAGHLAFAGGDVLATLNRWGDRVKHVHFKDVRADIVADAHAHDRSFLDAVVAGAFTVPGDGSLNFR